MNAYEEPQQRTWENTNRPETFAPPASRQEHILQQLSAIKQVSSLPIVFAVASKGLIFVLSRIWSVGNENLPPHRMGFQFKTKRSPSDSLSHQQWSLFSFFACFFSLSPLYLFIYLCVIISIFDQSILMKENILGCVLLIAIHLSRLKNTMKQKQSDW